MTMFSFRGSIIRSEGGKSNGPVRQKAEKAERGRKKGPAIKGCRAGFLYDGILYDRFPYA